VGGSGAVRGGSSSSGGSIDRGTAPRSRWARIAAFISSRCDSSSTAIRVRRRACASFRTLAAMCFEVDSEPPIPRISGAAVSHDDLVLESEDGNRFAAFRALPEEVLQLRTGIVILPDVRGLYRFYEELALRFAERGHAALAFDYFGRTAGIEKRPDDWDYMPLVQQLTMDQVQADVGACVSDLRTLGCSSIFTVGFCYGGSGSWAAAASGHGLAGAVGFYGRPSRMIELVPKLEAPILALQGGADQGIPHEDNVEFEQALSEAGKDYELVEFEGAPHSFFDRKQEEFQAASDEAWNRALAFIEANS
jgi:carboxymethylenebutenolidase